MRSCASAIPLVVVPVGRLAIDDWIGRAPLADVVGRRFERDGRVDRAPPPPLRRERVDERRGQPRRSSPQAVAQLRDTLL